MKKILSILLVAFALTANAQRNYEIENQLKLKTVNKGTASDSVLVRGADKLVKFIPRSEFGGGVISEAPLDGNLYGRKNAGWENIPSYSYSQMNSDWNSSIGVSQILNKPTFKTINGKSLLGSGDLVISSDSVSDASATESGRVNNTVLQELGGVDKLINGVRIGRGAGSSVSSSTLLGFGLTSNTTGYSNTAFGFNTLNANTTGYANTGVGVNSLRFNLTGESNVALGNQSLTNNTQGNFNTAVGNNTLVSNNIGGLNTAVGNNALGSNTAGNGNTAIGGSALQSNTNGSNNIGVGRFAGNLVYGGNSNTNTNNSIYIGYDSRPLGDNQDNQIVIGASAVGGGANTTTIGNNSTTTTILKGQVRAQNYKLNALNTAPASASDTGAVGEIRITATHIYWCISTNTWIRAAGSTF